MGNRIMGNRETTLDLTIRSMILAIMLEKNRKDCPPVYKEMFNKWESHLNEAINATETGNKN